MRLLRLSLGLFALVLASACTNESSGADAGAADAYVPPYAEVLFAPCLYDWQCEVLGEGAFCRTSAEGPAGGMCTRPCMDRTPCDAFGSHHHCLDVDGTGSSVCVPACRNGADCPRAGYTCFGELDPTGDGFCMSVCTSDADCGGDAVCNAESGVCQAPPVVPAAGFNATCDFDDDCTSNFCVEERNDSGTPSGWVQGACLAPCILPAGFGGEQFYSGDTLPTAGCASGGVCIPAGNDAEGDLGTCYPSCAMDSDCREGFGCLRSIGTSTFTNGVCVPRDCTGGTCPAGRTCRQVTLSDGSTVGRCSL